MLVIKVLITTLFFFFCISSYISADEPERIPVFDYSNDFRSYVEVVSGINSENWHPKKDEQKNEKTQIEEDETEDEQDVVLKIASAELPMYAVIMRTNGVELTTFDDNILFMVKGPENHYMLYYGTEQDAQLAASRLRQVSGVLYAELDSEVEVMETDGSESEESEETTTSFYSWGAEKMGFSYYLPYIEKWQSASSTVAVIDTGVSPHSLIFPKLQGSGFDYVDNDYDSTSDENGHGTHVAGIIADCTQGINVFIYPIRVLNASGTGKMSNFINAIAEARNKGVEVINLSLSSKTASEAMDFEIEESVSAGITVVIAAGNQNTDTANMHPSNLRDAGVVVVGSVLESGEKASYSNYGESVDVYAYGSGISSCSTAGDLAVRSGTSQAAPHISSVCAMMKALHPELAPAEVEKRIIIGSEMSGNYLIPDLMRMIPKEEGFSLESLKLVVGERINLPGSAYPVSSCENITYYSADENVVKISDGRLEATCNGETIVTSFCLGFGEKSFTVVVKESGETIVLPEELSKVETEALEIDAYKVVLPEGLVSIEKGNFEHITGLICVPDSVNEIGMQCFGDSVIICALDSYVADYAKENGLQYIVY